MSSPIISNSLLRADSVKGDLPAPFERVSKRMDFWVLELPMLDSDDITTWSERIAKILAGHGNLLTQLRTSGVSLTLFLELEADEPLLRLEAEFLHELSQHGISIEFSKEAKGRWLA